jgi:hypothetical protein
VKCHDRQIALLLLVALVGLTVAVAPQGAFGKGSDDAERAAKGRQKAVEAMWWNEPEIVSHLSLSEEQRQNMDGQYRTYLDTGPPRRDSIGREAFAEALAAGDWNGARARLDEMAKAAAVPLREQGELKIRLLSQLSKEQHQRLVEKYPQLLRRPWVTRRANSTSRRKSVGKSR